MANRQTQTETPDFEFSHVQSVPVEFYAPFANAKDETRAGRIARLQFDLMLARMGETNCRREAATWAMRENSHRKKAQAIDDELRELGVTP